MDIIEISHLADFDSNLSFRTTGLVPSQSLKVSQRYIWHGSKGWMRARRVGEDEEREEGRQNVNPGGKPTSAYFKLLKLTLI